MGFLDIFGGGGGGGASTGQLGYMSPSGPSLAEPFGTSLRPTGFEPMSIGYANRVRQGFETHPGRYPLGFLGINEREGNPFALRDLMADFAFNPLGFDPSEQAAIDLVRGQAPGQAQQALDIFNLEAIPFARNVMNTGLPVDTSAIIPVAQRFLEENLAQQRETFGNFLPGTDFDFARAREIERFAENIFKEMIPYEERRQQRRLGGSGLLTGLGTAAATLPTSLGQSMFGFGTNVRNLEEAMRRRPLDLLASMAGLVAPQNIGYVQSGFQPIDPTAGTLGALGDVIGGLGPVLGNILGGGGGPTADPTNAIMSLSNIFGGFGG